jgi:hypothetical protein
LNDAVVLIRRVAQHPADHAIGGSPGEHPEIPAAECNG